MADDVKVKRELTSITSPAMTSLDCPHFRDRPRRRVCARARSDVDIDDARRRVARRRHNPDPVAPRDGAMSASTSYVDSAMDAQANALPPRSCSARAGCVPNAEPPAMASLGKVIRLSRGGPRRDINFCGNCFYRPCVSGTRPSKKIAYRDLVLLARRLNPQIREGHHAELRQLIGMVEGVERR